MSWPGPVTMDATKRVPPGDNSCGRMGMLDPVSGKDGGPRFVVAGAGDDGHDEARPSRKAPAHHPVCEVFNRATIVFVTVCAKNRQSLFGSSKAHDLLVNVWREAGAWLVGRYVIMPDHIHLFCSPGKPDYPALAKWVQYWKSLASRRWPQPCPNPLWQKSFWDTQLRRGESYAEKWNYVRNNPVRDGLCVTPEEWPWQGELNVLMWHD